MHKRTYGKSNIVHAVIFALCIMLCGCSSKEPAKEPDPNPDIVIEIKLDDDKADEPIQAEEEPVDTLAEEETYPEGFSEEIKLDPAWEFADSSVINTGSAVLYRASTDRKNIVVGVNAGHGTDGGSSVKTYCHPDRSPKTTGGSTPAGALKAAAVSGGMTFRDGTKEEAVTLSEAVCLKDKLLAKGYDVLMLRDGEDVQLDNVARTVIANNNATCLISIHWDGDESKSDKGCFYISVPEKIKSMYPVSEHWQEHEKLGESLIEGLKSAGCKIYDNGKMAIDLTQTSYSTIPSIDVELGNQAAAHDETALSKLADGLGSGVDLFFK